MARRYKIAIIGSGNLAWHLAPELENAGHPVTQIYSRDFKKASLLEERLYDTEINSTLDFSASDAKVFILCVSDDAIQDVAKEIVLPENAVVVHTSGSRPLQDLDYTASDMLGVLYPLQTFTRGTRVDFSEIPFLITATDDSTGKLLKEIAASLSRKIYPVGDQQRLGVHLAAVFACNFSNYLFSISDDILKEMGFDLEMLRPLIAETLNKSLDIGPKNAQTGPARRGDLETLDMHMQYLEDSEYQELYRLISEKILEGF